MCHERSDVRLGLKLPNAVLNDMLLSPAVPFATRRLPPIGSPTFHRYYETANEVTADN